MEEKILGEMDVRFNQMDEKFEKKFDEKFQDIDKKFDQKFEDMDKKFDKKFEDMNEKFDKKFEDMDEKFNKKIEDMGKRILDQLFLFEHEYGTKIDAIFDAVSLELDKNLEKTQKISNLENRMNRNEVTIFSHEERISKLELNR